MKNLLILFCILLLFSNCGSKKKITDIKKGYEYVQVKQKETAEEVKDVKVTDTTKTKTKSSETTDSKVIERYIFDDEGRVKEYTKETNIKNQKNSDIEEVKGLTGTLNSVAKITNESDSIVKKEDYSKNTNLDKKGPNQILMWIGIGLFVGIIIWVVKKVWF